MTSIIPRINLRNSRRFVASNSRKPASRRIRVFSACRGRPWILCAGLLVLAASAVPAQTVLSDWVPVFKGVEHAAGTNTPGTGAFWNLQVVHCLRVDLTDPDIRLFASPRVTNYTVGYRETAGYSATNLLRKYSLQAVVNANQFYLPGSSGGPSYTVPEGTVFNVAGLFMSQGEVVSQQTSSDDAAALLFTTNNTASFVPTNWPARDTTGIFTAVAGPYAILVNGVNVGSNYINSRDSIHGIEPRTAIGLSKDRRYLYLLVIDGRQEGYSDGAYDWETAAWMLLAGAWDAANMDGGGSSCMAIMQSTTRPLVLNKDSASAAYGRERVVGAQFGLYAKALPEFFDEVTVVPTDTTARISWTTSDPVSTQVKYSLTTDLELASALDPLLSTNHTVLLTNLTPATEYYFALLGTNATSQYTSSTFLFVTTNYVTTNELFVLSAAWTYTTDNLDGVSWSAAGYDDSAWGGPGAGALWTDSRGANSDISIPLTTEMPLNTATGYPYRTYYLRTHFPFTNSVSGVGLLFESYIDDGAVFYLNGAEIYRLRMADAPTKIYNSTLANDYGCSGDATCSETFYVPSSVIAANLVAGDNVLAVEVHNYNAGSPDITFGLAAAYTLPFSVSSTAPQLNLSYSNGNFTLSWEGNGFTLQQAADLTGTWSDVPGPVTASPYVITTSNNALFFRLRN